MIKTKAIITGIHGFHGSQSDDCDFVEVQFMVKKGSDFPFDELIKHAKCKNTINIKITKARNEH